VGTGSGDSSARKLRTRAISKGRWRGGGTVTGTCRHQRFVSRARLQSTRLGSPARKPQTRRHSVPLSGESGASASFQLPSFRSRSHDRTLSKL
jgi:hypothetical protein